MVFSGEEEEVVALMGNGSGEGDRMTVKIFDNEDDKSTESPPENKMRKMRIGGGHDEIDVMRERLLVDMKFEDEKIKYAILKEKEIDGSGDGGEGSPAVREKIGKRKVSFQQPLSSLPSKPFLVLKFHAFSPASDDLSPPSPAPPFTCSFIMASFIFSASTFRSSSNLSHTSLISSSPPSIINLLILFFGNDTIDGSSSLSEIF
ncbi:hypothetical protein MTR_4g086830 [Medicago truncatula]|uniref:Uncharacterized protein n=1 Tax=Medicago truncatula TaxID=3880 RepID=G7JMH9_MEDTR|nr:hypothetical protein MTR_4g086830 [Medicago truncatula]